MNHTPDPTTDAAAPLTAEQIAAIRTLNAQRDSECPWLMRTAEIRWQLERMARNAIIPALDMIEARDREIAALRDRLARAEARERELRAAGVRVLTSWDQEDEPDIVDAFEALRDVLGNPDTSRRDGLSSLAPTDGAARAGDEGATP
jgi:hypothetical protein